MISLTIVSFFLDIVFTVTILVTAQYIILMKQRRGTLFTTALQVAANDENRKFTEKDGLQFAIGIADVLNAPSHQDPLGR